MDNFHFLNLEYFFNAVAEFFIELGSPRTSLGHTASRAGEVSGLIFKFIIPVLILFFAGFAFFLFLRNQEMEQEEVERDYERIYHMQQSVSTDVKNRRWERVADLFQSNVPSDWRVAIIEADAMLDDLVTQLGYPGENLGEKLKNVDRGNFPTLNEAWEAHKVRNRIAHEGMEFQLSEYDKNKVFKMYERIFNDAEFI